MSTGQEFALGVSPNATWCPTDLTLDTLTQKMTADRCWQNMMTGVDGCKWLYLSARAKMISGPVWHMFGRLMLRIGGPFVAPVNGPFLKTVGLSYEDCIQWQVSVVEA